MNQTQASSGARSVVVNKRPVKSARYFYIAAAVLMAVFTAVGFGRFYTQGMAYPDREIAPPMKAAVITHGVAMTGWIVLLLVQPMLILGRKHRLHMKLGRIGAAFAIVIFGTGLWVAIRFVQTTPPEAIIWGVPPDQFFIVPFTAVFIFAAFVALGVAYRRTPKLHRTMMILATLAALSAAVSRIDPLNDLYVGTMWERLLGPYFFTMAFAVLLVGARWAMTRSLDRALAIGVAVLIAISLGIWQFAPTTAWQSFASLFIG